MKTTLNIPEDLLRQVMTVTRSKTKTDAVITALNEIIRRNKIERVLAGVGKVKIGEHWDKLRHER